MVCRLALRYSCGNKTAREDLIDAGISALHKFLMEHENELSEELFETKNFNIAVYERLWSKIGSEAQRLSKRSAVFSNFALRQKGKENKDSGTKTEVQFFGEISGSQIDDESEAGEYFTEEIVDTQSKADVQEVELLYDISRLLTEEEYTMFVEYYNGYTLSELGQEYGFSAVAAKKRLDKIRKKLMPLAESLRG